MDGPGKPEKPEVLYVGGLSGTAQPKATPVSRPAAKDVGVGKTEWPTTSLPREGLLELLAGDQHMIAANVRLAQSAANAQVESIAAKTAVLYAASELLYLAALKKMDHGVRQTPAPITLAEKRAYLVEALAVMDKLITPELQARDGKKYDTEVARKASVQDAIRKIDEGKVTLRVIFCPHCHKWTDADFTHCVHCYESVNPSAPRPVPQAAETAAPTARPVTTPTPAPAARPVVTPTPAPAARPVATPAPAPAPKASAAQVRYADESVKNWTSIPGETIVKKAHVIGLLKPEGGKFTYSMMVTDRRLLFWRESNSKKAGIAARISGAAVVALGGGLLGPLVAAGTRAALSEGPKPWVEIPLTAISSCGLQNGTGEFYITADQTYVLQNMEKYEQYIPQLVKNAKR